MRTLINGKKALLRFYSKFDTYLTAALKFGIALYTLYYISGRMGYMDGMAQLPLLLIIAAFCSFMSPNTLILAGTVYLVGQFYGCSLESAIAGGFFLILFLVLYFTFIPRQAYVVILTAICIGLRIPLIVPVVCALLLGLGTVAGIGFGTCLYYAVLRLSEKPAEAAGLGEELFNRVLELLQTLFLQEELIFTLVILCGVFLVVYLLRCLPVKYSWSIAYGAGILVYCMLTVIRALVSGTEVLWVQCLINVLAAAAAGILVQFFCFRLDYRKVQHLQFEDDDYYYYVKAVPKLDRSETDEEHFPDRDVEEDYYLD